MIYKRIDADVLAGLNFRSNRDELVSGRIFPVDSHFVAAVVENLDMTRYGCRGRSWQRWIGVPVLTIWSRRHPLAGRSGGRR